MSNVTWPPVYRIKEKPKREVKKEMCVSRAVSQINMVEPDKYFQLW